MSSAFVTGGSGFIGGRLIERLVADGFKVRALARSDAAAAKVAERGAEPVRGDLSDAAAMRVGAEGCDIAFHSAATLGDWGPRAEFDRGNVEGTRNTVTACEAAGVRRFVHVGTEAALMDGQPLIDVDETAPLRPDSRAPYSATKALAEQIVVEANRDGRFETVVVRPRFVWGRGDTTLLPEMVAMVDAGRFAWVGGGRNRTSTTHVDNVVEGLILGATKGRPGNAYFVTDGEPVQFREFVTELLATQGVTPPNRSLPVPVAHAVAVAGETAWRALPLPGRPPLSYFAFWIVSEDCTIRIDKARAELGYEPITNRAEGMAELRAG
jgi:nucleoside-diphosphate-sugar epimerase